MTGRVVVLAHPHDTGAAAVAAAVAARLGPDAVRVLRPETLALAGWSHRIGETGQAATLLTLPGGTLDAADVSCLFNRLRHVPLGRFRRAPPKDREYAAAEFQALVASWLAGLGTRVVNPAGPRGLATGPASVRGWLALAAACGLPVTRRVTATSGALAGAPGPGELVSPLGPWPGGQRGRMPAQVAPDATLPPAGTVLVSGEQARGELAGPFGPACIQVARRAGCQLLAFHFVTAGGEPKLLEVDPLPPLDREADVAAVAGFLETVAVSAAGVP